MTLSFKTLGNELDVLVIGAGLSGIGAAYYLKRDCSDKTFAIVETRSRIGGTWDLFRYPGIRSDSDLFTYGYAFKPWKSSTAIADGGSILNYINEAATENGIDRSICFGVKALESNWISSERRWKVTLECQSSKKTRVIYAKWVLSATGYYDYDEAYAPRFRGIEKFKGNVIHPQFWPEKFDYTGKKIVVIGSGATAITLIPSMTELAEHVTMLQRTPTYVVNLPLVDPIADKLRKFLGEEKAFKLIRRKNVFLSNAFWRFCQNFPNAARKLIVNGIRKQLPSDFDVDTHFNPPYNPWDQRLCTVPDGDFFKAISAGKASVETDTLAEFVGDGIKLTTSGKELKADVVITATGFKLKMFGGMDVKIDGEKQNLGEKVSYKGMMLNDIPNLAFIVGYTNSSWTLKVDLLCEQFCKIQNYMTEHDYEQCVPKLPTGYFETRPLLDFGAGYVQRALSELPRQGRKAPWKMSMDFDSDVRLIRRSPVKDVYLHFNRGEHDKRSHAQDGLVTASA